MEYQVRVGVNAFLVERHLVVPLKGDTKRGRE